MAIKKSRRDQGPRGNPAREAAQAEVIADLTNAALKKYGSLAAWWDDVGVPRATGSNFINNKGRFKPPTLRKLLAPLILAEQPELVFEERVQQKLAERSQFRPILLATCIAPFSIDALTLRFGSHEANLTMAELMGTSTDSATYVHGLFLQRTSGSLPSNLERPPARGIRHPTRHTPLTYLRHARAQTEYWSLHCSEPGIGLLVLDKWGMELGPRMFGIIRPSRRLHLTERSQFEASLIAGESEQTATGTLRDALTNAQVLYETTHAYLFLKHLLDKLKIHHSQCKLIQVGSIGAAYQLAEHNILSPCLLAVGHELLWSLSEKTESTLELLVSDEGPHEKHLLPNEPPFRILAVRSDALSNHELDLTARWFQKMSANLRRVWEERFPLLCEFVKPELEKYGSLGGHHSETHLRQLIAHGMHLHHPPLDEEPRFVPLDKYQIPLPQLPPRPAAGGSMPTAFSEPADPRQPQKQEPADGKQSESTDDTSRGAPRAYQ